MQNERKKSSNRIRARGRTNIMYLKKSAIIAVNLQAKLYKRAVFLGNAQDLINKKIKEILCDKT